ncbi:MAG: hypothetical protein HC836_48035 [Richelia sp. RM2_1_2]|nr:hypothetical protein [Richelia sp. RM1_1_1]NJO65572.1 hypothetical protein [Richelia sp. RM2_1_2]
MSETSKYQNQFKINQVGNLNTGDTKIEGDQIGIQHNYALEQKIKQALSELKPILEKIQHQHPTTNEQQVTDIIEVEFREIERTQPRKWQEILQQLISLKRWFNGSKAAASETIKHYFNDSVQAKAFIAFLEGFSADV